uniref:Uncharacterized protein n=1 Tax=Oryza meridionalis TaxID=40149 RepID=A0A0E0F178_9ORYZ
MALSSSTSALLSAEVVTTVTGRQAGDWAYKLTRQRSAPPASVLTSPTLMPSLLALSVTFLGALPSSFFLPVLLAQGTWVWESNDDTLVIESVFSCFGVAGSSSQGLCGWSYVPLEKKYGPLPLRLLPLPLPPAPTVVVVGVVPKLSKRIMAKLAPVGPSHMVSHTPRNLMRKLRLVPKKGLLTPEVK